MNIDSIDKTAISDLFTDQINYFLDLYQSKIFLTSRQFSKLTKVLCTMNVYFSFRGIPET